MIWLFAILLAAGLAIGVASAVIGNKSKKAFFNRPDGLADWCDVFPQSPEADIRAFLDLIADCYAIKPNLALKLKPRDRIMDLYRALYPPKWSVADGLETESFAFELERRYALVLKAI